MAFSTFQLLYFDCAGGAAYNSCTAAKEGRKEETKE